MKSFLPDLFCLKTTKSTIIDTETEVWLPDKVTAVPTVMPKIKTLKLMLYNLDHLRGSAKIKFHLLINLSTRLSHSQKIVEFVLDVIQHKNKWNIQSRIKILARKTTKIQYKFRYFLVHIWFIIFWERLIFPSVRFMKPHLLH